MNLAVLSFRLPAEGKKRGGVERVAHDLADGLARRGHRVEVWSADPAPERAAYRVRPLPLGGLVHSWLGIRIVSGYLGNLLALLPRYGAVDAVIAHGDSLLLPLRRVPVLRVMHGTAFDEARTARSWPRKLLQSGVWIQEVLTARTQMTIGVSRNTAERNRAVRRVAPNGVDTRIFRPNGPRSEHPSILFVGGLTGRKRGALLTGWFASSIRAAAPGAELWMVSERGPEVEGVCYVTGASNAQLAELYRRAWVYASPSAYEGFGLPYLEAMASGAAVVATANAGSREVLGGGRYGVLVEDDEDFPAAVLRLLKDEGARREWQAAGFERARELSLERTLDCYESALIELVGRSEARA